MGQGDRAGRGLEGRCQWRGPRELEEEGDGRWRRQLTPAPHNRVQSACIGGPSCRQAAWRRGPLQTSLPEFESQLGVGGEHSLYDNLNACLDRFGVGPASMPEILAVFPKLLSGCPIQRLLTWLQKVRESSCDTERPRAASSRCLLPAHLPFRPRLEPAASRRRKRAIAAREVAWSVAEWLTAAYGYFESGAPKNIEQYEAAFGVYEVTPQQEATFSEPRCSHRRDLPRFCRRRLDSRQKIFVGSDSESWEQSSGGDPESGHLGRQGSGPVEDLVAEPSCYK